MIEVIPKVNAENFDILCKLRLCPKVPELVDILAFDHGEDLGQIKEPHRERVPRHHILQHLLPQLVLLLLVCGLLYLLHDTLGVHVVFENREVERLCYLKLRNLPVLWRLWKGNVI